MPALRKHRLVAADFRSAFDWYDEQRPGLGLEFAGDFRRAYHRLRRGAQLCSIRFAKVRRLNLERFPYGIFFVLLPDKIRVLAVLHASRDTGRILAVRRRTFDPRQT